jgi:hypothetical protein
MGKVTQLKSFGFDNIPDLKTLKEKRLDQEREYSELRKNDVKPKFMVSTKKRPNHSGN